MPGNVASWWQSRQSGIVFEVLFVHRVAVDVMHFERHA
jgi:hypothetical protein